jgi:hypothetical protein
MYEKAKRRTNQEPNRVILNQILKGRTDDVSKKAG